MYIVQYRINRRLMKIMLLYKHLFTNSVELNMMCIDYVKMPKMVSQLRDMSAIKTITL